MNSIDEKINLSSDLYIRNTIIADIIAALRGEKRQLSIIDIGGYDGKLDQFINTEHRYTILDVFDYHTENYIRGDVRKLDLPDESYDVVVSSEMLEHISKSDRNKAVQEMLRVAKQYLIIGAPFFQKSSVDAERQFNDFYRSVTGNEHPWLREHIENGLPDAESFERILVDNGSGFKKVKTGNIQLWYLLQCIILYGEVHYIDDYKKAIRFYNEHYAEIGDFEEPVNRYIYIITKSDNQLPDDVLQLLSGYENVEVNPDAYFTFISLFFNALNKNYQQQVGNVEMTKRLIKKVLRRP